MSLAVYDIENNRVDHVWSMDDAGEVTFTQYAYTSAGDLAYTLSGATRTSVEGVTGIDAETVSTLTDVEITSLLGEDMSLAVYDTVENRVDHVWSRDAAGEVSFTNYIYNTNGVLSFTITGSDRTSVENVIGITPETIDSMSALEMESYLAPGMSIAVYDEFGRKVSYVWAMNDEGDISFTQYYYNDEGQLAYVITGATKAEVEAVGEVTDVAGLDAAAVEALLTAGMSISVYDTVNNRVDHVWSMNDASEVAFTQYTYNADGDLAYTITGATRTDVESVTGITPETVGLLNADDIAMLLGTEMSLGVYDTDNSRVAYVWTTNDVGEVNYTKYNYNLDGDLVYTITGATRAEVEAITGITIDNATILTDAEVESLLGAGMSIAVYDIDNNIIDHVWSRSAVGDVTFTLYTYNTNNELSYTLTGDLR